MAIIGHQKFNARTFLNTVGKGRTIDNYRRNQIVYAQGDASNAVFHIHKGKVKVAVVSKQGKEAVSAVLGPGEFFGEGCISGQARRVATVTAMTEANIMRIEKLEFIRVLKDEHTLSDTFISHLVARTIRTEADLVDQLFNSSEKRLARLLLILANFGNDTPPEPIIAKISQETHADMIGTTRSRVSFFMNRFRRLGYIDYNVGRIEVKKALLNSVLHDTPQIRP